MADKIFLNSHFAFRSDTLENWQRENAVLKNGEPSIVSDGNENEWLKIGDGVTTWNDLPFKTGWIRALYNCNFNNLKINDENNVVGYKGYKMIGYNLINDGKAVEIELRDAELEEKAREKYAIGDLVNIDASTHTYQHQKITNITTNYVGNSVITLEEVNGDKISFTLEPESELENWLWIAEKSYGEVVPLFSYAIAGGINTTAVGYGAFTAGRDNKVFGNYGTAIGRKTLAAFCGVATGLQTKATGLRAATFGTNTIASGADSLAMGVKSKTFAPSSFAGGDASKTYGVGSLAYGLRSNAEGDYQAVVGKDNIPDDIALFIVGNGTYEKKSNAFVVNKNGTATVKKDPVNNMDVATKQYVDRLEKEIEALKQAIINLGGTINV